MSKYNFLLQIFADRPRNIKEIKIIVSDTTEKKAGNRAKKWARDNYNQDSCYVCLWESDFDNSDILKTINLDKEKQNMTTNKTETVIKNLKNTNISAVKTTAKIMAGKALNITIQEKITPQLPLMVRGYAGTKIGQVIIANMAATAMTYYDPENEKLQVISQAMLDAAMLELASMFDIEKFIKDFLSSDAAKILTDD